MQGVLAAVVHTLCTGLMFVYFGLGGALLSWVVLPIVRLRERTFEGKAQACLRLVRLGYVQFHSLMRWMRLIDFDPRGVTASLPEGPCLIVANHPTLVDITAVLSAFPNTCTVVRSSLFHLPFFGPALQYCGHIDAGDGGAMSGAAVMQTAINRLRRGFNVVIFPEGTRSVPGSLHRFRRGAFEIALRANVSVVPLFITCTPPTLMKGLRWYALPKRVSLLQMELLSPVSPSHFGDDSRAFARYVESLLQTKYTAWLADHPLDTAILPAAPNPSVINS
jgi:1-acyl-sn-glycerol-3-phosphate acyltransferase